MKLYDIACALVNVLQYVSLSLQFDEVFKIVQLVLSVLSTIAIVVFKIIEWRKKAKQDGKIDEKEIKELTDIVSGGIDDIKDKVKKDK